MSAIELAKKYDRSLTLVLTALGVLFATYFAINRGIENLVAQSPSIVELRQINAVQAQINNTVAADVREIKTDIKSILEILPRKK